MLLQSAIPHTRRDPYNRQTMNALSHLVAARDARQRYHALIRASIETYGDRHQPTIPGISCDICQANMLHQPEDMLNHQTGGMIAGVYADHFPGHRKAALRAGATLITQQLDQAWECWQKSGRTRHRFLQMMQHFYL